MKKPNLFIVGAPKCGTTSMHYYLSQHPEIFMSNPKELYFFCTDLHKESDELGTGKMAEKFRTIENYLKIFENTQKELIVGESSVWYLYSKETSKNIYNYNKDAKIIIMLREPVGFLYSFHSQLLFNGEEIEKNFTKALELEMTRRKGKNIPKNVSFPSSLYYSELCKFSEQIERYLKYFDSKNIKIILFDDFSSDLINIYKNTLIFLDIKDYNLTPNFKLQNPRKKILFPKIRALIKKPIFWKIPKLLIPSSIYNKIRDFIYSLFISYKKPSLDSNLKKELMNKYKDEVIKLNKLLHNNNLIDKNLDLIELWGYDKI